MQNQAIYFSAKCSETVQKHCLRDSEDKEITFDLKAFPGEE